MSEPSEQAVIDAASLVQAAEPATKGAASRFDQLTKEKGIAAPEEGITLKQQQEWQATPEETKLDPKPDTKPDDKKPEPEKPGKDAVPDFSKKPEKAETKKEEPNYDEELKAHPAIKGEAAKSFKVVASQRDEFKAKAAELEAKIKELESRPQTTANDAKIAEYEKKVEELQSKLGRSDFANSPKIQAFNSQEKLQLDAAKSYLDGDDSQQAAVDTAAHLTGQKRLKALVDSGMNAETISAVAAHLARVDDIRAQKNGELENWQKSSKEYQDEQHAAQLREDSKRREIEETVFKSTLDKMIPELAGLQKVDGYEDWNKGAEANIATIKRLYNGQAELSEIAEILARGVAQPAERKLRENLQAKYELVRSELASLKAAANPKGEVRPGAEKGQQETGTVASRFEATLGAVKGQ